MSFCLCEMDAGWTFVVCGSFDPIHLPPSWKILVRKFDNEDLALFSRVSRALPGTSQLMDSKV